MIRPIREDEIEISISAEQDDMQVRGNALTSGDDELDRETEDGILSRLDRGDVWAWACVTVRGRFESLEASDSLGGCCYEDEKDFIANSGYYRDMVNQIVAQINDEAERLCRRLDNQSEVQ